MLILGSTALTACSAQNGTPSSHVSQSETSSKLSEVSESLASVYSKDEGTAGDADKSEVSRESSGSSSDDNSKKETASSPVSQSETSSRLSEVSESLFQTHPEASRKTSEASSEDNSRSVSESDSSEGDIIQEQSKESYSVAFFLKGTELSLSDSQKEKIYQLAKEAVSDTDTMLNQLLTSDDFEYARKNGIAVTVRIQKDKELIISMIVSDQDVLASDGGSAHALSRDISEELTVIAGLREPDPTKSSVSADDIELTLKSISLPSLDKKDIPDIYNIAKKAVDKSNVITPVLITANYEDAVIKQGAYAKIKNKKTGEVIDLYFSMGHPSYAVLNEKDSYVISQDELMSFYSIIINYDLKIPVSSKDLLRDTDIQILYYGKLFLTDSDTLIRFREIIMDNMVDDNCIDSEYPSNIDELALKNGVFGKFKDENNNIFKVCLRTAANGKNYYLILSKNECWTVSDSSIKEIEKLLGITLL